jgi:hypothetical protein
MGKLIIDEDVLFYILSDMVNQVFVKALDKIDVTEEVVENTIESIQINSERNSSFKLDINKYL